MDPEVGAIIPSYVDFVPTQVQWSPHENPLISTELVGKKVKIQGPEGFAYTIF